MVRKVQAAALKDPIVSKNMDHIRFLHIEEEMNP